MKVKLVYRMGGHIYVGEETAKRLLKTNMYAMPKHATNEEREAVGLEPEKTPESAEDDWNNVPESQDTPEATETQEPAKEQHRATPAEVRAWARENELDVPAKGRIPSEVFELYEQANSDKE